MYTHKFLPNTNNTSISYINLNAISSNLNRVIYNSDSVLKESDIALLQNLPLSRLNFLSTYIRGGISIEYSESPYITSYLSSDVIIQFPSIKGYINLDVIHSFELPSIELRLSKTQDIPATLYLIIREQEGNLNEHFTHLPIPLRPFGGYGYVDAKYSLVDVEGYTSYPLCRVLSTPEGYEIRLIKYESENERILSKCLGPESIVINSNSSYIASGFQTSITDKHIYIGSGVVYIQGLRIISSRTVRLDLTPLLTQDRDYNINVDSTHLWLGDPTVLGSHANKTISESNNWRTSKITLGNVRIRNGKAYYYEFIPRINTNWYTNSENRLNSLNNITASLLDALNTNSTSNLHITDFISKGDNTHPDYRVSYLQGRYPCPFHVEKIIPFRNLVITSSIVSHSSSDNQVSILGSNTESIPLIYVPIEGDTPSIQISQPNSYTDIVINTPLINANEVPRSITQVISRLRGFRPFSSITSVHVNGVPIPSLSISLGITGNGDTSIINIENIHKEHNEQTFKHEDKDSVLPLIDNNPLHITNIPSYLIGQTFTVTNSISISNIGIDVINTEYIRALSKYSSLICGVGIYKVGGDLIDTETLFYLGEYKLGTPSNASHIYIDSQPLISLELKAGKYIFVLIPYTHPIQIKTTSNAYVGGGRCVVSGGLRTISEELDNDIAFRIKGHYITNTITPRSIKLSLSNTSDIYPITSGINFRLEDTLKQLTNISTSIELKNNITEISLSTNSNKYISLEALSLVGTLYEQVGIWVSKPILMNRLNLNDIQLHITCNLPGASEVNAYISIDSSNSFTSMRINPRESILSSSREITTEFNIGSPLTILRYIIIKLEIKNDTRERDVIYIKEAIIKPIT